MSMSFRLNIMAINSTPIPIPPAGQLTIGSVRVPSVAINLSSLYLDLRTVGMTCGPSFRAHEPNSRSAVFSLLTDWMEVEPALENYFRQLEGRRLRVQISDAVPGFATVKVTITTFDSHGGEGSKFDRTVSAWGVSMGIDFIANLTGASSNPRLVPNRRG